MLSMSTIPPLRCHLGGGGFFLPRTPNRGALLSDPAASRRAFLYLIPASLPHDKQGFCCGGRPAFRRVSKIAVSVIPAICLTGETFPCSKGTL